METYKASPVTNTQNDTNVVSKYYPVLVRMGRGDGMSQGRAHARGASTPGARARQGRLRTQEADMHSGLTAWSVPNRVLSLEQTSLRHTPGLECA